MYSRSYYQTEGQSPSPPENYDGTAFSEQSERPPELPYEAADFIPEPKAEAVSSEPESLTASAKGFSLPFLSGSGGFSIGGLFGKEGGLLSNIGVEEILILAVAAYLIFSGSGDIECAIMLLLLLFIS